MVSSRSHFLQAPFKKNVQSEKYNIWKTQIIRKIQLFEKYKVWSVLALIHGVKQQSFPASQHHLPAQALLFTLQFHFKCLFVFFFISQ